MKFQGISFSRLVTIAIIAFTSTFATYVATAMQNANVVNLDQLMQIISVNSVKGLSIASAAALTSIIAFFTRPDMALPINSLTSEIFEKKED